MRAIINWFAGNSVASNLLMLGIIALGILSIPKLRMEVVPTIEANLIMITVPYPGAAPEEVEEGICARIEDNVQGISGIDEISATASENMGTVKLELLRGANRSKALADVQLIALIVSLWMRKNPLSAWWTSIPAP
jgi:multidrug efflux pump subunit AcrB